MLLFLLSAPPVPPVPVGATPGFPSHQTSVYSYSVQHHVPPDLQQEPPKNVQAGPPAVGKGPGSNNQNISAPTDAAAVAAAAAAAAAMGNIDSDKHSAVKPTAIKAKESKSSIKTNGKDLTQQLAAAAKKASELHPKVSASNVTSSYKLPQPMVVGQTTILPVVAGTTSKKPKDAVSPSVVVTTKSPLRDYRRPPTSKFAKSETSTPLTKTSPSLPSQQPLPANKRPVVVAQQAQDLFPSARKASSVTKPARILSTSAVVAASDNSKTAAESLYHHLPKGLTITEIQHSTASNNKSMSRPPPPVPKVTVTAKNVASTACAPTSTVNGVGRMPMINIPKPPTKRLPSLPQHQPRSITPTASGGGHPGLPNGLLKMATAAASSVQMPVRQVTTKVVPKDLKSQLALSRMGLSDVDAREVYLRPPSAPINSVSISVTMAQTAVTALKADMGPRKKPQTLLKQTKSSNNNGSLKKNGNKNHNNGSSKSSSPNSSRSSSRNSSLSPKDATSVRGPLRLSPPSSAGSLKKKSGPTQYLGPLVPWSKRNNGVPKDCNGWRWLGDGTEQKVLLNVRYSQLIAYMLLTSL